MLVAVAPGATAEAPDPYAIFSRARSRWSAQAYPRYLSYSVRISALEHGREITNTFASLADTSEHSIKVRATSDEEIAHPYVPHGVTIHSKITLSYAGKPVLGAAPTVDGGPATIKVTKNMRNSLPEQYEILGVPQLSPAYSFGIALQSALPMPQPAPASTIPLKTIAAVTAVQRDYDIAYAGMAAVDGAPCYHLRLSPRRDPGVFRLRELWIDESGFATRQALVQGNFTEGPGPRLRWLIHFTTVDGLTYIGDETALGTVRYIGHTYSNLTVAFTGIQSTAAPGTMWLLTMFKTSGDVLKEP
jgi:hypothetical protein